MACDSTSFYLGDWQRSNLVDLLITIQLFYSSDCVKEETSEWTAHFLAVSLFAKSHVCVCRLHTNMQRFGFENDHWRFSCVCKCWSEWNFTSCVLDDRQTCCEQCSDVKHISKWAVILLHLCSKLVTQLCSYHSNPVWFSFSCEIREMFKILFYKSRKRMMIFAVNKHTIKVVHPNISCILSNPFHHTVALKPRVYHTCREHENQYCWGSTTSNLKVTRVGH